MATLFCRWPAAGQARAEAYNAECGARYETLTGEADAVWGVVRADADGSWISPLLGPPWYYAVQGDFAEPATCLALRDDAEVVATPVWPSLDNA